MLEVIGTGKINLKWCVLFYLVYVELLAFSVDLELEERGKIEELAVTGHSCLCGANCCWRLEFSFLELCLQMLWVRVLTCMFKLLSIYLYSISEENTRMRILIKEDVIPEFLNYNSFI